MPAMRKRTKANEQEIPVVKESNQNNSHSSVKSKQKKFDDHDKVKPFGRKKLKATNNLELSQGHKWKFEEGDEIIDMEVQGNITSDGEVDSDSD